MDRTHKVELNSTSEDAYKQVLINEIERHKNERSDILVNLPLMLRRVEILQGFEKINKKANVIMLNKFRKLNAEYEYETDSEFQKLMLEKHKLMIDNHELDNKATIFNLNKQIQKMQDQLQYYDTVIENKEKELEGVDGNE